MTSARKVGTVTQAQGFPDQWKFWNGAEGLNWAKHQVGIDRLLQPFGHAAYGDLGLRTADRVMDVGCGCGGTTLDLAEIVGPKGYVLGVDISAPMLAQARRRTTGVAHVQLAHADVVCLDIPRIFNAIYSRLGLMFFRDPVRAFRHMRGALIEGGRIASVCWRSPEHNPWLSGATDREPLMFSLSDPSEVERIMRSAGFTALGIRPYAGTVVLEGDAALRWYESVDENTRRSYSRGLHTELGIPRAALPGSVWVIAGTAP